MDSKNPMARLITFSKIKKLINDFNGQEMTEIDKNLLRGLFVRKLKDYSEDLREKMKNRTLLQKLQAEDDPSTNF
jgi:hypothetical protein